MANNENDLEDLGGPGIRPRYRGSARVDPGETEPANPAPAWRRNDPIPDLKLIDVPLDELRPAARRVRRANKTQIARIRRSIERFGMVKPILITRDGEIVDGHELLEALRQIGVERVPCLRVDHLSELETRQLRLALNKIAETGSWDFDALKLEFEDLLNLDVDLEITGFEIGEIDQVLAIGEDDSADNLRRAASPAPRGMTSAS